MGAVAWAIRHRPVSHPRSSNRTCGFPASGFPTGFIARPTMSLGFARGSCAVRSNTFARRYSPFRQVLPFVVFAGRRPITVASPSSRTHQKSGSFPPPALPGLNARTTLSDSRHARRLQATLRPLPSCMTGLPRLPEPPFRRAVPTTPADRAGARVDCFPAHTAFPF